MVTDDSMILRLDCLESELVRGADGAPDSSSEVRMDQTGNLYRVKLLCDC
jgi:hypothetical protein